MNRDVIEYLLLIGLLFVLLIVYCVYVIIDEKQKVKYYNSIIHYDTHWDKYSDMVEKQKAIIRKKKLELFWLNTLVFFKGVVKWK